MIRKRNNKRLYESIMRDVAKAVKRHLKESSERCVLYIVTSIDEDEEYCNVDVEKIFNNYDEAIGWFLNNRHDDWCLYDCIRNKFFAASESFGEDSFDYYGDDLDETVTDGNGNEIGVITGLNLSDCNIHEVVTEDDYSCIPFILATK